MVFPWRFHIPVSWAAVPSRSAAISPWLATAKCASRGMPLRSPPRWHRAWQRRQRRSRSLGLWQLGWGSWQKDLFLASTMMVVGKQLGVRSKHHEASFNFGFYHMFLFCFNVLHVCISPHPPSTTTSQEPSQALVDEVIKTLDGSISRNMDLISLNQPWWWLDDCK